MTHENSHPVRMYRFPRTFSSLDLYTRPDGLLFFVCIFPELVGVVEQSCCQIDQMGFSRGQVEQPRLDYSEKVSRIARGSQSNDVGPRKMTFGIKGRTSGDASTLTTRYQIQK